MYTQPLVDAIAESERLVKEADFIESEADLLEGLQYLAGCVAACTHVAFDYDRDHPFLHSGTGPFTKNGPGQSGHHVLRHPGGGRQRVRRHR